MEPAVSVAKDDLDVVAENKVRCGSPTHSSGAAAVYMDPKRGYQSVDDKSCRSNPVFFEDSKNMVSDEDTTRREDPSSSADLRSNQFGVTSRMKSFILAAMAMVGWLPRGQEEGRSAVLGPTNAFSMGSMEPNIILDMESDEGPTQQEDPLPAADLQPNQSLLTSRIKSFIHAAMTLVGWLPRGQEEERIVVLGAASAFSRESVEPDMILIGVPIKVIAREQPVTSMSKSAIQVAMAVALVGASFTVMLAVPGGVNDSGTAVLGDTIALNVFFVMDTLALHASLTVGMMVATMSQISSKVEYLICITLWVAAVCFILAFHAAAYVVMFPDLRWIVLISGGIVAIPLALLSIFHLSTMFY
ncbi:uncharacterized protein LOC131876408 [Cryptomeria japonica]|uniref:uncharacterized protein LOC131876408 n=1 Tax=Cryptomeria japonica TaxID=3369 RepID=UPI0027DA5911|nr:uncharacterized protein LOC131876408 [Cryptomeria japonica]